MITNHLPHFKWQECKQNVNRWGLKLATYNITFKWISGAHNKAADCLSHLAELPNDTQIPNIYELICLTIGPKILFNRDFIINLQSSCVSINRNKRPTIGLYIYKLICFTIGL